MNSKIQLCASFTVLFQNVFCGELLIFLLEGTCVKYNMLLMCSSKKYPYLPTEGFFILTPHPLRISVPEGFVKIPASLQNLFFITLRIPRCFLQMEKIDLIGSNSYGQFFFLLFLLWPHGTILCYII